MPNIHSLPLMLFVLFAIAYTIGCVIVYIRLYKIARSKTKKKLAYPKFSYTRLGIIILTLASIFLMSKWIVLQMLNGCTPTFFWNPHCYDLNRLCRPWLLICILIGVNAIVLSILLDLRAQAERVQRRKK